jgi:hypothetical protein
MAPGAHGDGALGERGAQAQGRRAVSVGCGWVWLVALDREDEGGSNGCRIMVWR